MVEAKQFPTFVIEPLGTDIINPTGFIVRKMLANAESTTTYESNKFSTLLQDISDTMCSASTSVGCRIYLKNGTYKINQGPATDGGLVVFGTTEEGGHVSVYMEGETRDGCIIKNIETAPEETPTSQIIRAKCSLSVNNLTVDGDDISPSGCNSLNGIKGYGQTNGSPVLEAHNCRFTKIHSTCFSTGSNWSTFIMENCILEKPVSNGDQSNFEIDPTRAGFAIVRNNFFDRTNGTYTGQGSTITSGGSHNALVTGNIIKRPSAAASIGNTAISFETFWDQPTSQVTISNHLIDNGEIKIGQGGGAADQTASDVFITGNTIYKGGIHVEGPTGAGQYVYDIFIENNLLLDAWEAGIFVKNTGGFVTVRNNTIKNSNSIKGNFNGQQTLIFLNTCTDLFCENNFLYMGVVSPPDANFSPQGIRFTGLVNSTIRNNRILNRTVSNNSYQDNGSNTGCLISRHD
jgi:hypothetical protein